MEPAFAQLVTDHLPNSPGALNADVRLRESGLDSIHAIDLLMAIEDAYEVEFPTQLLTDATFATAGSLWSALEQVRAGGETQ